MSGGIDWGAGQRAQAAFLAYCSANCTSATPLTTTFVAPSFCSQLWTPAIITTTSFVSEINPGPSIQFTRNVTASACLPSEVAQRESSQNFCGDCSSSSGIPWISPGVCPQGWPTAYEGIASGITTGYCCPP
jgi:hypothetical protein